MRILPYPRLRRIVFSAAAGALCSVGTHASPNPTSKFYVADVSGDVQVNTGTRVDDLTKHSVYNADGTVIETKPDSVNAMVFSNGTGIFFDPGTRLEVKKFEQEPFVPGRTDMDVEPSVSQTQAFLPFGTVGLCTSKLVAGSSMNYRTPLGGVNIQGGKVVIQSNAGSTVISDLGGESTVNAGQLDSGGEVLHDGEQAIITPNPNGGAPLMTVQPIPSNQTQALGNLVTMACASKKTVYFEVRTLRTNTPIPIATNVTLAPLPSNTASGGGDITAFDGDDGVAPTTTPTGPTGGAPAQVIVAVPVAPSNVVVQFEVSPATLTSGSSGG